jgi:outer membrane lipoprotein-sorting protein
LLALLVSSTASSTVSSTATAESVLDRLEKAGRALETMQASFVETKTLVLLDETEQHRGTVLLRVPGRLRWDYTLPRASVTLIKDGRFARYLPHTKQVFRGAAKGEADLLVGFGPGAAELGEKYQVRLVGEEQVGDGPTYVLDLTPNPEESSSGLFSSIRLWIEQERHVPVQTRLTEPTGDFTTIRFDDVVINGKLPGDAFELELPADVTESELD